MSSKYYICPFCKRRYIQKEPLLVHMDDKHQEDLNGLSPKQVYFNFKNNYELTKGNGKSVISGKPTAWNEVTGRYERFLPEEKEQYRQYFLNNMKRAGKADIMKDMEHQKEMLAHRKISGTYKFSDGSEKTYTGSYEKKFLEYLDVILHFQGSDIYAPALQIFPYKDPETNGLRYHIPDFYITSLNLIVNIKSSTNRGYRLRDIESERAQDNAIKASDFNYIKIYDNQFDKFVDGLNQIKNNYENGIMKRVIVENTIMPSNLSESLDILLN